VTLMFSLMANLGRSSGGKETRMPWARRPMLKIFIRPFNGVEAALGPQTG